MIGGAIASAVLLLVACSPAAAPASQSTPGSSGAASKPAAAGTSQQASASTMKPKTVAELAAYTGPDRQQILEEGAKQEGKVSHYWTLAGEVIQQLPAAFQKKYPNINVEVYRGDTGEVVSRVTSEAQANKSSMDVAGLGEAGLLAIRDAKITIPYFTPAAKDFEPASYKAADAGKYQWVIDAQTCFAFAYNTTLLPENAVPKTYKDLLNPALKAKMALASSSTGSNLIGNLVTHQGTDFVQQFAQQELQVQAISGRAMLDLIINGEIPASPTIYESHTRQSIQKNAPVKWVPLEPVTCSNDGAALAANAPHPHAALLYIDFLLSPEAQKIVEDLYYNSPAKPTTYVRWAPETGFSNAAEFDKTYTEWRKLMQTLFISR
jgi:iron(III) transport system substrate-binding protein